MSCESTKNCCSKIAIKCDAKDKKEKVLWLHDVYNQPIYNPDEGIPRTLRVFFASWKELVCFATVGASLITFIITFCLVEWVYVDVKCPPSLSAPTAIRETITLNYGLWNRCFGNGSNADVLSCIPWDETWENWGGSSILSCYFTMEEYRDIDYPIAASDVHISRRLIGSGMGFIMLFRVAADLEYIAKTRRI